MLAETCPGGAGFVDVGLPIDDATLAALEAPPTLGFEGA